MMASSMSQHEPAWVCKNWLKEKKGLTIGSSPTKWIAAFSLLFFFFFWFVFFFFNFGFLLLLSSSSSLLLQTEFLAAFWVAAVGSNNCACFYGFGRSSGGDGGELAGEQVDESSSSQGLQSFKKRYLSSLVRGKKKRKKKPKKPNFL